MKLCRHRQCALPFLDLIQSGGPASLGPIRHAFCGLGYSQLDRQKRARPDMSVTHESSRLAPSVPRPVRA